MIEAIEKLPDISFIDNLSLSALQRQMETAFQDKYKEITGIEMRLEKADPIRIILSACAQYIYQGLVQVDKAGKMNFLKYAYGDYLDHLAAFRGLQRLQPTCATVTLKWSLAEPRSSMTFIPKGSMVTADWRIYFKTTKQVIIPKNSLDVTVEAVCTTAGTVGNGFGVGDMVKMVDPVAYIASVTNTTVSSGGTDTETDEELAGRIYLAPSGYSTAGTDDAYKYHMLQFDKNISDIYLQHSTDGTKIFYVHKDGSMPTWDEIYAMQDFITGAEIKPFGDSITVDMPIGWAYTIDLTYYIAAEDQASESLIQAAVAEAIDEYVTWQNSKFGRPISPQKLISNLISAGACRVEITRPVGDIAHPTPTNAVCLEERGNRNVVYGGLE